MVEKGMMRSCHLIYTLRGKGLCYEYCYYMVIRAGVWRRKTAWDAMMLHGSQF